MRGCGGRQRGGTIRAGKSGKYGRAGKRKAALDAWRGGEEAAVGGRSAGGKPPRGEPGAKKGRQIDARGKNRC